MDFLASFANGLPGATSQGLIWGIMAIGVYISFRVLDFADLTVDSSLATGGAVSAMLITGGMNPLLSLIFSTLAGMCAGAITGFLNTKLGIQPILSGILAQQALYAINMRILGRANVGLNKLPKIVSLSNIPMAIFVGLIFAAAIIVFLYWFFGTELGCAIRATGDNRKMVRAQGVNTNATKMIGLVLSNGLVGLCGGLLAQYNGAADIGMGRGAIVIGLASVIIGEVIIGSKFSFGFRLASIFVGAIIYFMVTVFVLQLDIRADDLKMFNAIVLAVALGVPYLRKKYGKVNSPKNKVALAQGYDEEEQKDEGEA